MTESKVEKKGAAIGPKTRLLDILRMAGADSFTIGKFSESPHISIREIRDTWGEIKWDTDKLSYRQDIDFDLVLKYPRHFWNWYKLSLFVKEETVRLYPDLPWKYLKLSENDNISMRFVASCSKKPWDWRYVSAYSIMSQEGMRALVKSGFINFAYASCNKTLTIDILREYPDADWDMTEVSCSAGITDADIAQNPQIKWCDVGLCMRRNIPERLVGSIHKIVASTGMARLQHGIHPKYMLRNSHIPIDETFLALNDRMTHGFVKLMSDVQLNGRALVENIALRWSADSEEAISYQRRFAQRWTTSPGDVWRLAGGSIAKFVELLEPADGIWLGFADVSKVMGRRIVKHVKPYTWVTRRRRLAILMEVFAGMALFPPGVVRLIAGLL